MSGGALFGNNASRGASKNLVEFKAGKMTKKGRMVYPDNRKGQLYVYQSDDSLMHFCWKDRTTGVVEDDLIIFPDDCEFKHVPQCKTGRVYLLRFNSSNRKFFVWLQDLKTDKDEEYCKKINELLNDPPIPRSQRSGSVHPEDVQNFFSQMSQHQLIEFLGSSEGQMWSGGLNSILSTMNRHHGIHRTRASTTTASTPVTTTVVRPPTTQTPAPAAVTESVKSNSNNKTTARTPAPSTPVAATGTNNKVLLSDLKNFLSGIPTPAVQSGQAGPVVRQHGLGPDAVNAAAIGNIEEFVRALVAEAKAGQGQAQEDQDDKSKKQSSPVPPAPAAVTESLKSNSNDKTTARTPAPSTPVTATGTNNKVLLSDLKNFLSGIPTPAVQRGVATELTNAIPAAISATESLERAMTVHLPPGDNLCTTLSSPQFSQALSMFWSTLQSGQAGPVIRQFGLGPDAVNAAAIGNIEEFVRALVAEAKADQGQVQEGQDDKSKKQSSPEASPDKKDDDDEEMALD